MAYRYSIIFKSITRWYEKSKNFDVEQDRINGLKKDVETVDEDYSFIKGSKPENNANEVKALMAQNRASRAEIAKSLLAKNEEINSEKKEVHIEKEKTIEKTEINNSKNEKENELIFKVFSKVDDLAGYLDKLISKLDVMQINNEKGTDEGKDVDGKDVANDSENDVKEKKEEVEKTINEENKEGGSIKNKKSIKEITDEDVFNAI